MIDSSMSLEELDKVVTEREILFRDIINLVESAGLLIKPKKVEELQSYTIVERDINDFYGFDIEYHIGCSNSIKIKKDRELLLYLTYWEGEDTIKAEFVSKNNAWETSMRELLKDPKHAINMYKKARDDKKNDLMKKANYLGMNSTNS